MELSDWFKGFEKGIAKLTADKESNSFLSVEKTVFNVELFRFIRTCMNGQMETSTAFSLKPMNCRV